VRKRTWTTTKGSELQARPERTSGAGQCNRGKPTAMKLEPGNGRPWPSARRVERLNGRDGMTGHT
jgi:hypothetical protein